MGESRPTDAFGFKVAGPVPRHPNDPARARDGIGARLKSTGDELSLCGQSLSAYVEPAGQTLIVTDGVGWIQVEDQEVQEFATGDILLCPADRPHWHGATPDGPMTHIAIQETVDGTNVTWMDPVTDDQYLARRTASDGGA